MVKTRTILYFPFFLALTSCYVVIPKKYFNNYSTILINNRVNPKFFDISKTYLKIYSKNEEFSNKYNKEIYDCSYYFFYGNNLCARITLPLYIDSTKQWILDEKEYLVAAQQKLLNDTEDYSWYYFEIIDSTFFLYSVKYDVGNWNILNIGKVIKTKGEIIKDAISYKNSANKKRTKFNDTSNQIIEKTQLTYKPDSSKADIYCMYSFQPKSYRRIYSTNSPNYVNPCLRKELNNNKLRKK
jgi:hypothetical protein